MSSFPVPFALAFIVAAALTPVVRTVARRLGVVAEPRPDRWHRAPVALLGGIAVAVAVWITSALLASGGRDPRALIWIGIGMFAIGFMDDLISLKPQQKLALQVAVACVGPILNARLDWTSSAALNSLLTILWIVGITNAFNLLDNMDGLCAGIAAIAAVALALAIGNPGPQVAYAAAVAGAALGFLIYNFNPATVFMGDSGSLFVGSTLAVLTVVVEKHGQRQVASTIAVPLLLLLVPIFDTVFVTTMRKLSARAASRGGRDHTSHRLVAFGFSERNAVLLLYGVAAVAGGTAVALKQVPFIHALPLVGIVIIGMALLGAHLAGVRVYDGQDLAWLTSSKFTPLLVEFTYRRRVFEVLLDLGLIALAYYSSFVLRFEDAAGAHATTFLRTLPIVVGGEMAGFLAGGVYQGVWRHFSTRDLLRHTRAVVAGTLGALGAIAYLGEWQEGVASVAPIFGMLLLLLVVASRLSFRLLLEASRQHRVERAPVLIYGAGDLGVAAARELQANPDHSYWPIGFVDDDYRKHGKRVMGLPILGGQDSLEPLIHSHRPSAIVLGTTKLGGDTVAAVARLCERHGVRVMRFGMSLEIVESTRVGARETERAT